MDDAKKERGSFVQKVNPARLLAEQIILPLAFRTVESGSMLRNPSSHHQSGPLKTLLGLRPARFDSIINNADGNGLKPKATLEMGSETGYGPRARIRLDGRQAR